MKTEQLSRVLYAILTRLTPVDVQNVTNAMQNHHHAAMNEGNRAQLAAIKDLMDACDHAAGNVLDYDKRLIGDVINSAI